jgi:hypothetical protein
MDDKLEPWQGCLVSLGVFVFIVWLFADKIFPFVGLLIYNFFQTVFVALVCTLFFGTFAWLMMSKELRERNGFTDPITFTLMALNLKKEKPTPPPQAVKILYAKMTEEHRELLQGREYDDLTEPEKDIYDTIESYYKKQVKRWMEE